MPIPKTLKNILGSAVFIAILAVLLIVLSILVKPGSTVKVNALQDPLVNGILAEEKNSIDVVFLGDSESYSAFIPLKIWQDRGITSYVCGTSSQELCYSYELLTKSFKAQKPKVVVLETNTIFRNFSRSSVISTKAQGLFAVFRYHDRWKSLQPKGWSLTADKTYDDRSKGYLYSTTMNGASVEGYMEATEEKEPISSENSKYVEKIRDYCRKNGAELVLVSVPSTTNWDMRRHNAVTELAGRLEIEYIDMNLLGREIAIDWKRDTRDRGDHMNFTGAMKVSAYMGEFFASKNIFIDKRKDAMYKNWNEYAAEFAEATGKRLA